MLVHKINVIDLDGRPNICGDGIAWGNNGAWHCLECGRHLGGRTADSCYKVACDCGVEYEIDRSPNKNGKLNLGRAMGIRRIK